VSFLQAYGLAFAQQMKNKDIPEGGSKAVLLIDTLSSNLESRDFIMRKSVKAFTDSILDLLVKTDVSKKHVIDRWGAPEWLYLGPDEQVLNEDIIWVVEHAGRRGHPAPSTFMSSKPVCGAK
jgi:glutamate dehydrogenase